MTISPDRRSVHPAAAQNTMLSTFAGDPSFGNIRYLNLRGTLNTDLKKDAYKKSWANELHPTKAGFEAVTAKFANLIATL